MSDQHPSPSITSWDELPLMVPMEKVCELYGLTEEGVYKRTRRGGLPAPIVSHPMRWSRADLQRHWEGRSASNGRAGGLRRVRSA